MQMTISGMMKKYFGYGFAAIGYVLIIVALFALLNAGIYFSYILVVSVIFWIIIGILFFKLAELFGVEVNWFNKLENYFEELGYFRKVRDYFVTEEPDSKNNQISDEAKDDTPNLMDDWSASFGDFYHHYSHEFQNWSKTAGTYARGYGEDMNQWFNAAGGKVQVAGKNISGFDINSRKCFKLRLWFFVIAIPLLLWVVFWNLIHLVFSVWYMILGFSFTDGYNLALISVLILLYTIIIRVYSYCTNNRTIPISTTVLSDYDPYVVSHLFQTPKKIEHYWLTAKALLLDFIIGWLILIYAIFGLGADPSTFQSIIPLDANFLSLVISLIAIAVFTPIIEELLFRGYVLDVLSEAYGKWFSIIVSAILFALIHVDPLRVFNAFFGGVIYGYVRVQTNSLWPSIILHSLWNAHLIILVTLVWA